jgi:hypothetical protein
MPHTSRKGWLARFDCYRSNPFTSGANDLRPIAAQTFGYFRRAIARAADPFSLRLIAAVVSARSPSYLDLDERTAEYNDVGRPCRCRNADGKRRVMPIEDRLDRLPEWDTNRRD